MKGTRGRVGGGRGDNREIANGATVTTFTSAPSTEFIDRSEFSTRKERLAKIAVFRESGNWNGPSHRQWNRLTRVFVTLRLSKLDWHRDWKPLFLSVKWKLANRGSTATCITIKASVIVILTTTLLASKIEGSNGPQFEVKFQSKYSRYTNLRI